MDVQSDTQNYIHTRERCCIRFIISFELCREGQKLCYITKLSKALNDYRLYRANRCNWNISGSLRGLNKKKLYIETGIYTHVQKKIDDVHSLYIYERSWESAKGYIHTLVWRALRSFLSLSFLRLQRVPKFLHYKSDFFFYECLYSCWII